MKRERSVAAASATGRPQTQAICGGREDNEVWPSPILQAAGDQIEAGAVAGPGPRVAGHSGRVKLRRTAAGILRQDRRPIVRLVLLRLQPSKIGDGASGTFAAADRGIRREAGLGREIFPWPGCADLADEVLHRGLRRGREVRLRIAKPGRQHARQ